MHKLQRENDIYDSRNDNENKFDSSDVISRVILTRKIKTTIMIIMINKNDDDNENEGDDNNSDTDDKE